jgi:hypothetical protein
MASAENAKLQYEAGQTSYAMAALTDSGDSTTFEGAAAPWSGRSGYDVVVRPDGLISGGTATPTPATNNSVTIAAGTAYVAGVLVSFDADDVVITRAADSDTHIINSIILDASGNLTAIQGTDGLSFVATRGDAGGPPLITADKIEICQVRTTSRTDGVLSASEITAVPGVSQERYDTPVITEIDMYAGTVTFGAALPAIHADSKPKKVWASFAVPSFADVPKVKDFVPPENTFSVSSEQIYGGTIGSTSQSLGQGSFVAFLDDGVNDALVRLKGENLWFRFYPDRAKSAHLVSQGYLGISRTFPAGGQIQANCTINAESAATEVS